MIAAGAASIAGDDAFLGVFRSLGGRRWRQRAGDDLLGLALAQRLELPEVLGRILAGRGIDLDSAARHLAPTLRDHLPDPSCLKDMDRAVARLSRAVIDREQIAILGDYDVDGATSTALLQRYFEALGLSVIPYVPDRRAEGYGPNTPALLKLREMGAGLVITVDCGTMAHEPLAAAAAAGLDVIVIDHHAAGASLPLAVAVVNPNRLDDDSGLGMLAAIGVTFLVLVALNRALRQTGAVAAGAVPDLLGFLDLVALGTVCDVVPLIGLNRALVAQGLKVLAQRNNPGLAALADVAALAERPDAYHLGYVLGPRVNAGGRVGKSDLGCRLLAASEEHEARAVALELDRLNEERRAIEADVLARAIEQVEQSGGSGPVILAHGDGWHPGVIGIVAGRLKERYNRPACVIAWDAGVGKGSGRSVPGIDLGAAVIAARQAGLLDAGGGHAMAAGFTVAAHRHAELAAFLAERFGKPEDFIEPLPELGIDGVLQPAACTAELCQTLGALGPFGAGNAEPRFVLPQVSVIKADPVGKGHIRCLIASGGSRERLKAIAFRAIDTPLAPALLHSPGRVLHLAGHLRADTWQGRADVQLIVEDAAWA